MLSDEEVVAIVRKHIESKFPKVCAVCGRRFASLAEYLRGTTHVGDPVSGDPIDKPLPARPIGTISYANCSCGSTLVISSAGLDLLRMWSLLRWARANASRRGISVNRVLADLRERIDAQVLSEYASDHALPGTATSMSDRSWGEPITTTRVDRTPASVPAFPTCRPRSSRVQAARRRVRSRPDWSRFAVRAESTRGSAA